MKFALLVQAHPDSQAAKSALKFAECLGQAGYILETVFFYGEGIWQLSHSDQAWIELGKKYNFTLQACSTGALKRNISAPLGYQLVGLAKLIEAELNVDRLVQFGM